MAVSDSTLHLEKEIGPSWLHLLFDLKTDLGVVNSSFTCSLEKSADKTLTVGASPPSDSG